MATHGPIAIVPKCPRCGYDQSGEVAAWTDRCPVEGRCPECGGVFLWSVALKPGPHHPRWSVEHAGTLRRIAFGWMVMPAHCIVPGRYWKHMWNAEPVRIGRIMVFLIVWWTLVRTVCSAIMGLGLFYHQNGPISSANWRFFANGDGFRELARYVGLSWKGTLPLIGMAGWDTEDRLEYFFIAGAVPAISVAWAMCLLTGIGQRRSARYSTTRIGRSALMSMVIVPIAYESARLIGALQSIWFTGPPDALLIGITVLPIVWVLVWWGSLARHPLVRVNKLAVCCFHFGSLLLGGVIHIGVYLALERMF